MPATNAFRTPTAATTLRPTLAPRLQLRTGPCKRAPWRSRCGNWGGSTGNSYAATWIEARHQRRICGTTLASERGGRSSWRRPGTATTTPSSASHRWRPLLVPPRSLKACPRRPSNEPHGSRRRASAQDGTGTVPPIRQPSRRRRVRRTLGRRGRACLDLAQFHQHRLEVADASRDSQRTLATEDRAG
jgi:hypothetical protein